MKITLDESDLAIVRREVGKFLRVSVRPWKVGDDKRYEAAKIDDMIGAGNEGLVNAYRTFDPARGASWQTWATTCIRQELYRTRTRRCAMGGAHQIVDIERPFGDDDDDGSNDWTFDETLTDEDRAVFWRERTLEKRRRAAAKKDHDEDRFPVSVWQSLRETMSDRRQFSVLLMRQLYYSHAEIAKRFRVSAERIRQIEIEALSSAETAICKSHGVRPPFKTEAPRLWIEHGPPPQDRLGAMMEAKPARPTATVPTHFWLVDTKSGLRPFAGNVPSAAETLTATALRRSEPVRFFQNSDWYALLVAATCEAASDLNVSLQPKEPELVVSDLTTQLMALADHFKSDRQPNAA